MKKNNVLLKWITGCVLVVAAFGAGILGSRMIDSRIHPDESTEEPEIIMDDYMIVDEFPVLNDENTTVNGESGTDSTMSDSSVKTEEQSAEPGVTTEEQHSDSSTVQSEEEPLPEQSQSEPPEAQEQQPEGTDPVPTDSPLGENETPILPIG